jgi:ABC-2 type transport system permease protein
VGTVEDHVRTAVTPQLSSVFVALTRSEWTKLRTVRSHADVSITQPGVLRAVIGGAVHLVLIGAIAVGVGTALRRTAGAVAVLFAILLVVPGLVTLLPSPWNNDVTKFLPSSAGVAMSALVHFPNLLSPLGGFLVLCGYAAVTLILAGWLLVRRDA